MGFLHKASLLVLSLTVAELAPLFGQSGATEQDLQQPECTFDIGRFDRTPRTSPELIRLESKLIDPLFPVTQTLILQLNTQAGRDAYSIPRTSSSAQTDKPTGKEPPRHHYDFSGKYLDILAYALPQKKGEALIESLFTLTEDQFLRIRPMEPATQHCFQQAIARTLPSVPLEAQSRILFLGEYPLFKSAALTSYLQQLYESVEDQIVDDQGDPTFDRERLARGYRTRILKRIYEADPDTGREIILEEIASELPRSDIEALKMLPDETLPDMDPVFARQLPTVYESANWGEYNTKLGVIERYATAAILPAMKSIYLHDPDDRNQYHQFLFLSYFLRTDPAFGRQLVENRLRILQSNCSDPLFTELAGIRSQPELKEIAREHLDDPNKCVAANAAYSFKYMGSGNVEPLLWQDLEAWHKEWATRSEPIPYPEQNYEDSLVEALLFGTGPCRCRDTVERLSHIYIKGNSTNGNIAFPEWHDPVKIIVQPHVIQSPLFSVDFCSGLLSVEQLKAAIPGFPQKTEFEWYGPADPAVQSLLEPARLDVEQTVKQHGMSFHLHSVN